MKLPNGERADLGVKLEDDVLNPLHGEGQHRARGAGDHGTADYEALRPVMLYAAETLVHKELPCVSFPKDQ